MMKKIISGIMAGIILALCISVFAQNTEIIIEKLPLKYIFNGVEKVPAEGEEGFIYNDRTYVPVRFVSESLNKNVEWDEETYTINISDEKEMNITEYKWYKSLLQDIDVTEEECSVRIIGSFENYVTVEVSVHKGDVNDWYVKLYRCESEGENFKLIENTQIYVGRFNYAAHNNYCIYNKLDEDNNIYLEVKDLGTLEVTATIYNTYDEHIYDGSIICMVQEDGKNELRSISMDNGFVKKIKSFPKEVDLKIFQDGKYLHVMCTDLENKEIYYYEVL